MTPAPRLALGACALVLAMLVVGVVLRRVGLLGEAAAERLNTAVLYVCLPATILIHAPRLRLEVDVLAIVLVPWVLIAVALVLVPLLSRHLGLARDEHAVLLLAVALGNTSFLGYPMVRALLGEEAMPHAVIYDQFGSFLALSTFGLVVVARYAGDRPPTVRQTVTRIVSFPPLIALVVGLTIMPRQPGPQVARILELLAAALLPLVMLAIGLTLRLRLPSGQHRALAAGLGLKLVAMPFIALGLVTLLGLGGAAADAVVLESAMPPMITAAALAIARRLAPGLAAALVGYGIVLALVTLPAWAWILR